MGVVGRAVDLVLEYRDVPLDPAASVTLPLGGRSGGRPLCLTRNVGLLAAAPRGRRRRRALGGRSGPAGRRCGCGFWCRPVFPDQIAGCRVERLNDAARIRQIHDAVVNERRGLIGAGIVHRPGPRELHLVDILLVDLCERAVAPVVVRPPPVQPVAGGRIAQHLLRHVRVGRQLGRPQVPDLRHDGQAGDDDRRDREGNLLLHVNAPWCTGAHHFTCNPRRRMRGGRMVDGWKYDEVV